MQQEIRPFLAACLALACAVAGGTSCTTVPLASRHPQAACARYVYAKKEFSADIHWCARYVELRGDVMEVHVSWEILRLAGGTNAIFQITDEHNARMYLTDEAGRRYDHLRVSGAALGSRHRPGSVQSGSFFFPLPKAGARTFQFHDVENGVRLELRL